MHAVAEDELGREIAEADLIVACSGRGHSLFPEAFLVAGSTLVLDLALHSDLHPLIRHHEDIEVITLADLTIEVDDQAAPVVAQAQAIIAEGVEQFRSRQLDRRIDPAMAAIRRTVAEAADAEVARLRRTRDDAVADDLERSIRRILAKVMHSPTMRARELAQSGNAADVAAAVHTLFGIDLPAEPSRAAEAPTADWVALARTAPVVEA